MAAQKKAAPRKARRAAARRKPSSNGNGAAPVAPTGALIPAAGEERPIEDAIVLHVIRDVEGVKGNDGILPELRGNVRPSEIAHFLAKLTAPAAPQ